MGSTDDKLNSLFQELEHIKETYADLSAGSIDTNSKMPWTQYKQEYVKFGDGIDHTEYSIT